MTESPFFVEPLGPAHDRATFSCGVAELDRYLKTQASQDIRRSIAAVFVLVDRSENALAGYYTLSATVIESISLPPELARRMPSYEALPATMIGRLAISLRYRGRTLGGVLLTDALKRAYLNRTTVAAMAVVVDALDESAGAFYEHYGFSRFKDRPLRLYLPMATIKTFFSP